MAPLRSHSEYLHVPHTPSIGEPNSTYRRYPHKPLNACIQMNSINFLVWPLCSTIMLKGKPTEIPTGLVPNYDLQNRGTLLHPLVKYHCLRELFFHLGGILYPYFQSDPNIVLSWCSIASPSYLPEYSWIYCLNHHKLVVKNSRNRLYIIHFLPN